MFHHPHPISGDRRGFTLIEVVVALAVFDRSPGPGQPDAGLQIKKKGHVRDQRRHGQAMHGANQVQSEAPSAALMGQRGIHITVADHGPPCIQSWLDDGADMLHAVGTIQQQFRRRIDRPAFRIQQDRSQAPAERGPSGLPCHLARMAAALH